MKNKHLKITIDILMALFAVLSFSGWDDMEIIHYVVGSICYLLFAVHFYLNRQWMASVKKAWKTGKLTKPVKWQYSVSWSLKIVWLISFVTGIIAMMAHIGKIEALIRIFSGDSGIHVISSWIGFILILVHIFQHQRQIRSYFKEQYKHFLNLTSTKR